MHVNDKGELSARAVNLVLGIWLFISAFVWPHDHAQMTNTWILGVLAVIFSLVAMRVQAVRYVNTLLSIWLFISAFALPHLHRGTVWNNALVALVMFFVSLQSFEPRAGTASDEQAHAT
jgi:SPW repeat